MEADVSSKQLLKRALLRLTAKNVAGTSGLAILTATSVLALGPTVDITGVATWLGGIGLGVLGNVLHQWYDGLSKAPSQNEDERLIHLAAKLTPLIDADPLLRDDIGKFLRQSNSLEVAKEVLSANPAINGWLLVRIYNDIKQYAPNIESIGAELSALSSSVRNIEVTLAEPTPSSRLAKLLEICLAKNQVYLRDYLASPDSGRKPSKGSIYVHRKSLEDDFARFLRETDSEPFFLVTGEAGMGKTTTLCYLLKHLTQARMSSETTGQNLVPDIDSPYLALFIPGYINNRKDNVNAIEDLVRDVLDARNMGTSFSELNRDILVPLGKTFVIFLDAINESTSPDLRAQLDVLSEQLRGTRIKVCMSCRSDFLAGFLRGGWTEAIHKSPVQSASAKLGEFTSEEFEQASRSYLEAYEIRGSIPGAAKKLCRVPLMMKFFARTYAGKNLQRQGTEIQRAFQIFEDYAKYALERLYRSYPQLNDKLERLKSAGVTSIDSLAQRYVRGFLLQVACHMRDFSTNRLEIPYELHRLETAMRERYPELGDREQGFFERTVYQAFLSERIILEEAEVEEASEWGEVSKTRWIRFPFEKYLEFSLARYIVRSWIERQFTVDQILKDFRSLMQEHERKSSLAQQANGDSGTQAAFYNIRGALSFVIQIVETEPYFVKRIDDVLYLRLLDLLASGVPGKASPNSESDPVYSTQAAEVLMVDPDLYFTWKALACSIITQLKLAWSLSELPATATQERHEAYLRDIINKLARQRDFTIRWELEGTLVDLVTSKKADRFVSDLLISWLKDTDFLRNLYTAELLGDLGYTNPENAIELMQQISEGTQDFWIQRALGYSSISLARHLAKSGKEEQAKSLVDLIEPIAITATEPLSRSRSLAQLLELQSITGDDWQILEKIDWAAEHMWVQRNVVEALGRLINNVRPSDQQRGLSVVRSLLGTNTLAVDVKYATIQALKYFAHVDRAFVEDCLRAQTLWETVEQPGETWMQEARIEVQRQLDMYSEDYIVPYVERMNRCALLYHPEFLNLPLYNHPECTERLEAILSDTRHHTNSFLDWPILSIKHSATFEDLITAHDRDYIERIDAVSRQLATQAERSGQQDQVALLEEFDFEIRPTSYSLSCLAAGAIKRAVDLVIEQDYSFVFGLVRPPGHLAGNRICIFNNIAIAARYFQKRQEGIYRDEQGRTRTPRVLIVDCDNHHGLNTYQNFLEDDTILYFSIHQEIVHPGTGRADQMGKDRGLGYTFGIPIPEYSGNQEFEYILNSLFVPVALRFRPDIILVSAGFDSHFKDRFCTMRYTEEAYGSLARTLRDICVGLKETDGRSRGIVASLEGGYSLDTMGLCVLHMLAAFEDRLELPSVEAAPRTKKHEHIAQVVRNTVGTIVRHMEAISNQISYPLFDPEDYAASSMAPGVNGGTE